MSTDRRALQVTTTANASAMGADDTLVRTEIDRVVNHKDNLSTL